MNALRSRVNCWRGRHRSVPRPATDAQVRDRLSVLAGEYLRGDQGAWFRAVGALTNHRPNLTTVEAEEILREVVSAARSVIARDDEYRFAQGYLADVLAHAVDTTPGVPEQSVVVTGRERAR